MDLGLPDLKIFKVISISQPRSLFKCAPPLLLPQVSSYASFLLLTFILLFMNNSCLYLTEPQYHPPQSDDGLVINYFLFDFYKFTYPWN
ncbi:Os12g0518000 [Oryza sativa Japonica Group]|uniref:Os12g0518000 protein n=1 Tax=Oryza sativa subsp. japonica TaxID=39947 RepID=Q0IMZ8_ORYSJ|nr:Os12g0518000 [Oryza sativa Japonica Group]|eukprot:NP_001066898.1 Os12g0518000 [Oryza sativa Japonica Group]